MTGDASVIALDRLRSGDSADRGDLLDIVFGWADFAKLRRQLSCPAPRPAKMRELCEPSEPNEPAGADSGRGLWLAATLADELGITSKPDSTIVSLYMRLN